MTQTADAAQYAPFAVHADFPRTSQYDPQWVFDHGMGWPVLWATESLCEKMELQPGMRVLDIGCGKALSSIFLAKEYGVQVWAAELWISPTENAATIRAQGLDEQVFPLHADARALPFAHEYFDAIVSLGAYHYFGTDDYFLKEFIKFLKPGGQLGISSPCYTEEFTDDVPAHLQRSYQDDGTGHGLFAFHSPAWWGRHWAKTGLVNVEVADTVPDGGLLWLQYDEALLQEIGECVRQDVEMLRADQGRYVGMSRVVARRR